MGGLLWRFNNMKRIPVRACKSWPLYTGGLESRLDCTFHYPREQDQHEYMTFRQHRNAAIFCNSRMKRRSPGSTLPPPLSAPRLQTEETGSTLPSYRGKLAWAGTPGSNQTPKTLLGESIFPQVVSQPAHANLTNQRRVSQSADRTG